MLKKAYLRGEGRVRAQGDKQRQIAKAFHEAYEDFLEQHGRQPDWDTVTFQGGFTTREIIFELSEEVDG